MDHGSDELNVLLPAMLGVVVLALVALASLSLAYLLQYTVVRFNAPPFAVSVLKGFGILGVSLTLVVILAVMVLEAFAPH